MCMYDCVNMVIVYCKHVRYNGIETDDGETGSGQNTLRAEEDDS